MRLLCLSLFSLLITPALLGDEHAEFITKARTLTCVELSVEADVPMQKRLPLRGEWFGEKLAPTAGTKEGEHRGV